MTTESTARPCRPLITMIVALLGVLSGTACLGQVAFGASFGPGGFGAADISRGEVESYADLLGLGDVQREAAMMLHDAYTEESRTAAERMQRRMEDLRLQAEEEGDYSIMFERMGEIMQEAAKGAQAREARFFDDLRSLLDETQAEQWSKVERARRREVGLRGGMVSGADVDLVKIVRGARADAEEPPSQELGDLLEAYEQEMDRILVDLMREQEERAEKVQEMMSEGGGPFAMDMETVGEMMQAARAAALRLRDANKRHAGAIEAALPESLRDEFARRLQRATFPRVYRESHTQRVLDAVQGFDDLTEEQRRLIGDIGQRYGAELEQVNERWARQIEKADESEDGGSVGGMSIMFGGDQPAELKEARRARRELDRKTLESIEQVLTQEQIDRLPDRRDGADDEPMMRFQQIRGG